MAKTKKEKIPAGVRQEFDDIDYWKKLKKSKETFTLADGTVLSAYEYMKKFMQEGYGNGFSRKQPETNILQTPEQKSWGIRNNNNTNRDAFNVAKKSNTLTTKDFLLERGRLEETEKWEQKLKYNSYDEALSELLELTGKEAGIEINHQTKMSLLRFYFRIKKLLSFIRKDRKNGQT